MVYEHASVLRYMHIACFVSKRILLLPEHFKAYWLCYIMHRQFNIQQLYVLLTLYLCVLYLSEN
jgi:hypothetical protein